MRDWEANWNRDVLKHIVVLLFALADLADRAAGAPFRRRRQVLEILGYGEAEARTFVIGMVSGAAAPLDELEFDDDAAHLAVRLRALALVLCVMLARRVALRGIDGPRAGQGNAAEPADRPAPPPIPDTS